MSEQIIPPESLEGEKNSAVNLAMFCLPNKPELTNEVFQERVEQLKKQYGIAVQHEAIRAEIKSKITDLLNASSDHYQKAQEILDKAPQEAAPELAGNLEYLPEGIREAIARLALDKAPQEAAPELAGNLRYLPEGIREAIARLALDKAPQEAAPELAGNLEYLPEGIREAIARLALDKAPQEAAPKLAGNLRYLPEGIREAIARLALDKAPQEAAPKLAWNLEYLPEGIQVEIARLALDKAPQEVAPKLAGNLRYLPEGIREAIARLALDKAPQEAAPELAGNLRYLPEGIREAIARLALDKAPQEAAPKLAWNLEYLPEGIREAIARLALDKAPQEAAPELAGNLGYLPERIREAIENEAMQIVQMAKKETLSRAEQRNPVLYKYVDELDEQFLRKQFPKTGTETLLLGKTLINNVILRIIPNNAFISWMNAYKAVDTWKKAGFDYVPVEPIIKAHTPKDGKNTRVYSGVLGISVSEYLEMHSNRNHHDNVRKQVEKIKGVLEEMGITHGHTHNENFCILHERTPEGEIDWDKPPRVYCIDFDQSVSS